MTILFNAFLFAVTLLLGLLPFWLTYRFRTRLRELSGGAQPERLPPAALILPCKGLDPGFESNVRSFLEQDYPELELVFVVATQDDPAHAALQKLLAEEDFEPSRERIKLVVAGLNEGRSQKLNNQLAAVEHISDVSQIMVFVDSDIRPDAGFVRRLVAPLSMPGVGATTGYRWYHPPRATLGSMLRSTWNAGGMPFLVDPKRNFAWGGAMAIRREVFRDAKVAEAWAHAATEDFPLTVAVRGHGLEVRFVPECMAVSYEASTLAETLEFTNRQSLLSRVYFPPLWWSTAVGHSAANLLLLYGIVSFALWLHGGSAAHLVGAGCLVLLPMQLANAAWLFESVPQLLPRLSEEVAALRWHYVFAAPLASIVTLVNTVSSATTRRMTWRGVEYELRSPVETIVLSRND